MAAIAVIPGDGVGKEVIPAGLRVLETVTSLNVEVLPWGAEHYEKTGAMMPSDSLSRLDSFDAIYLGAVGWPTVPDHASLWGLLLPIRKAFELYVNLRPVKLFPGVRGPLADRGPDDIDMLFVRENTEGEYSGTGGRVHVGTPIEVAVEAPIFTRAAVERVVRYAFARACERSRTLVSVTKSNASRYQYVLWDEVVAEVSLEFSDVTVQRMHVDAMAARMVLRPDTIDVVVGSNLFADILTDLGAALQGSLGLGASANLNPERRPHAPAPGVERRGIAGGGGDRHRPRRRRRAHQRPGRDGEHRGGRRCGHQRPARPAARQRERGGRGHMSADLTARLSRFVAETRLDAVPAEVVTRAKHSMLDGFGLAVAGARTEAAAIAEDEIRSYRCENGASTVLGGGTKLPARFAAFLNGLAIHADDFDDTQLAVLPDRVYGLLTHPTAPVLPAVLALAEERQRSGAETLLAYMVGVEAECAIAESIDPRHYEAGFHSTGTAGAIGAAAGAARLLGMGAEATATALGLGASQASGLRESFGTMTKPFHAGHAAESGVLAASLVARGFTAARNILEAGRGFFSAAGGGYDPSKLTDPLGDPWTLLSPGVSIKPYPSGSLTHPAMTAFLELMKAHQLRSKDVEEVRVGTNRHMPNALIHHRPDDHLAAKFSMEFCIAILLLRGRARRVRRRGGARSRGPCRHRTGALRGRSRSRRRRLQQHDQHHQGAAPRRPGRRGSCGLRQG